MKTKGVFGIAILVLVIGIAATSCVTASSIGGTSDAHGLFSGGAAKKAVTADGAQEIASYSTILNIFDSGYAQYAEAVKAAEAEGKQITTTTTFLFVLNKTTAYAK